MAQYEYEILAEGIGFGEGPVWRESQQDLIFASVSTGRVLKWSEDEGITTLVTLPSGGANGLAEGLDGTIYVAQCGGHSPAQRDPRAPGGVQAVRTDGSVDWVSLQQVASNDLCLGPDGYLYVTDPTRPPNRNDGRLWRVDPETGDALLLLSVVYFINGIGFDLNNDLYVSSSNDRRLIRFPFSDGGVLGQPEIAVQMSHNHPDGFAFDTDNNITIAAFSREEGTPGDVQLWTPDGEFIESFEVGHSLKVTNVALTVEAVLYITVGDGQKVIRVPGRPAPGIRLHPFRDNSR